MATTSTTPTRRSTVTTTPPLFQAEEGDCGAACLAILLAHHGRHAGAHEVREVCGVSRNGLTAAALVHAAARYGLRGAGKRLSTQDHRALVRALRTVPTPAITLLRGSHFAVLDGVTRHGRIVLNDPAAGRRVLPAAEFAELFSQLVLTFTVDAGFRTGGRPRGWAFACARWLAPYGRQLLLATGSGLLTGVFLVACALLVTGSAAWLGAVLVVAAGLATFAQRRLVSTVATDLSVHRSREFLSVLLGLPGEFFRRRFAAGVASRVPFVETTFVLLAHRTIPVLAGVATLLVALPALAVLAPQLAAAVAVGVVTCGVLRDRAGQAAGEARRRLVGVQARRHAVAVLGLSMIDTLRLEGADADLRDELADITGIDVALRRDIEAPAGRWLAAAAGAELATLLAVLLLAASGLAGGWLAGPRLLACLVLLGPVLLTARATIDAAVELPRFVGRLGWLDDVLDAGSAPRPAAIADPPAVRPGVVELTDVNFGHDPNRAPLLAGVTLHVAPGSRVAVTGGAGGGKSALLGLIAGTLTPWHGEVRVDRESVAHVGPRPCLFAGTVEDNITLWDHGIPADRVAAAVRDSCLDDVLALREGGLAAPVEQDGRNFSGGERCRIALARALARDPFVLLLDEALDALDPDLADRIEHALRRRRVTTFTVTGRPAPDADVVVLVEQGGVTVS
jgi:ABC-type bacteriocin/lantibiotic exporter with double-glycine peptidase domain